MCGKVGLFKYYSKMHKMGIFLNVQYNCTKIMHPK